EELKIAGENISENEIMDTFLTAQDDNEDDDNIKASSLKEENNDINANEGLPEPYILIIQNTMDL
ncbi:12164_t:CDS:1, partial [Entrophospora sp. SA101]